MNGARAIDDNARDGECPSITCVEDVAKDTDGTDAEATDEDVITDTDGTDAEAVDDTDSVTILNGGCPKELMLGLWAVAKSPEACLFGVLFGVQVRNASLLWSGAALTPLLDRSTKFAAFGIGRVGAGDGDVLTNGATPDVGAGDGGRLTGAGVPGVWLPLLGVPAPSMGAWHRNPARATGGGAAPEVTRECIVSIVLASQEAALMHCQFCRADFDSSKIGRAHV